MSHQKIVDRIKKLLALASNNPNENEAKLAAAQANALMLQHGLSLSAVEAEHEAKDGPQRYCFGSYFTKMSTWKARILSAVADMNNCAMVVMEYGGNVKRFGLLGYPSDAELVAVLSDWLIEQIARISRGRNTQKQGATWLNNFRHGMVDTIIQRLQFDRAMELAKAKRDGNTGLVLYNKRKDDVQELFRQTINGKRKAQQAKEDRQAYHEGLIAGHRVQLTANKRLNQ